MTTPNPPVRVSRFEVRRRVSGEAPMSDGSRQPYLLIQIRDRETGEIRTRWLPMVACLLCIPGGPVQGSKATDEQIIQAVMGDEHIFSGTPTHRDVS